MDPNVRFHLTQKCPSLRSIEKKLPLKICCLELGPFTIRVDKARYKLESADSASVNRLTIISSKRSEVDVFDHITNRNINVAMKYLIEKLFGGRTEPIQLRLLKIETLDDSTCCQFPSNLKLAIQGLKISNSTKKVLNELGHILDDSSFPLKLLQIANLTESNHNHQTIKTAQELVLSKSSSSGFIAQFVHRRVHFQENSYYYRDIYEIFRNWRLLGREVGTYFSFAIKHIELAKMLLQRVSKRPDARLEIPEQQIPRRSREQVIVPMNNNAEILMYYSITRGSPAMFNMKIQPKTNPIPL